MASTYSLTLQAKPWSGTGHFMASKEMGLVICQELCASNEVI